MPEITRSPDKQQITSNSTAPESSITDEINITEISSDDSSDCIIVEQAPAPFQETEAHNKGVPGEARKPNEEPKVKRVKFATLEHISPTPPSPPSEETSPAPPPPTPSSSTSGDDANLHTYSEVTILSINK